MKGIFLPLSVTILFSCFPCWALTPEALNGCWKLSTHECRSRQSPQHPLESEILVISAPFIYKKDQFPPPGLWSSSQPACVLKSLLSFQIERSQLISEFIRSEGGCDPSKLEAEGLAANLAEDYLEKNAIPTRVSSRRSQLRLDRSNSPQCPKAGDREVLVFSPVSGPQCEDTLLPSHSF